MNTVPEAIENYAHKFNIEKPTVYPTDRALRQTFQHCALTPRQSWFPRIRLVVMRQRSDALLNGSTDLFPADHFRPSALSDGYYS